MNLDNLIKMANQIGQFFEAMPDPAQAAVDVASHLRRSWEPRMRRELLTQFDTGAISGRLRPIVAEALRRHREVVLPAQP